MLIIGIDPGKSGGIAWMDELYIEPLAAKMPDTPHELSDMLRNILAISSAETARCYVEKVASTPQMGVKSAFTFGHGLGRIEGVLATLQISLEWVSPQKWQKTIGCSTGGDKNVSKRKAMELFPKTKWTHATADAGLIAEYGRRIERGAA